MVDCQPALQTISLRLPLFRLGCFLSISGVIFGTADSAVFCQYQVSISAERTGRAASTAAHSIDVENKRMPIVLYAHYSLSFPILFSYLMNLCLSNLHQETRARLLPKPRFLGCHKHFSVKFFCYWASNGQYGMSGQIGSHLSHQVNRGLSLST